MALVKTVAQVKEVLPNLSKLSNSAVLPNMDRAAWKYIIPIIGKELYDDLHTKYNAPSPTLTDAENELLGFIRTPLVAFAYVDNSGLLQATISDSGARRISTNEMPTLYKWEFDELINAIRTIANDGIEMLLDYLFNNKADFPLWTGSDTYQRITGRLIKSGLDFSKLYVLYQPFRTYWKLLPFMQDVEELYLANSLGRDLLKFIRAQEAVIVEDNGADVDVLDFLKRSVANYTILMATRKLTVRFGEDGFTVLSNGDMDSKEYAGRTAAAAAEVARIGREAEREGRNYLQKAIDYLKQIGGGEFDSDFSPEFLSDFASAFANSPLYAATNNPVTYDKGNGRRSIFRF